MIVRAQFLKRFRWFSDRFADWKRKPRSPSPATVSDNSDWEEIPQKNVRESWTQTLVPRAKKPQLDAAQEEASEMK